MEEEKIKLLLNETNLDICMDFLARMIEKYGDEMTLDHINEDVSKAV